MKTNCANCKFWNGDYTIPSQKNEVGACRRHSPTLFMHLLVKNDHEEGEEYWDSGNIQDATCFPITEAKDWCGDYEMDQVKCDAR